MRSTIVALLLAIVVAETTQSSVSEQRKTPTISNQPESNSAEACLPAKTNNVVAGTGNVADKWNWTAGVKDGASNATKPSLSAHFLMSASPPHPDDADPIILRHTRHVPHNNETNEEDLLATLSAKVSAMSAPFDAGRSPHASALCKAHVARYLAALANFDMWAVGMYDSAAKLPSGVLAGNINQLGNFDQCLAVNSALDERGSSAAAQSTEPVRGKYCLAYMQPIVPPEYQPRMRRLYDLVQSKEAFRSDFEDAGHRIPRFSMILWALCVPESCSAAEVDAALHETVADFLAGTGIQMQTRVEPQMCQTAETDTPYDRNTRWALYFFIGVLAWTVISTVFDYQLAQPNPYLVAFSLRRNVRALISLERAPTDIQAIHGIRFLNAFMLLLSHKSMALFFDPYVNRTQMTENIGQPWTVIGRAAAIYTDVFLMFSGLLTAYSLFGRLRRGQPTRLAQEYVGRLMRIVPTFGALILFCTYVLPILSSGPQWNLVVRSHAEICKQHWWKNMLFIHNYFGFENMCLTHTHHLGIDTELFAIAPLLILLVWRWPRRGIALVLVLAAISTVGRYYVSVVHELSNYVYFGATIKRLFRTADLMYAIPFHRATIYLLGILLGYVLQMCKDYRLSTSQLRWGWIISSLLFAAIFIGPAPMGSIHYRYNAHHAAIYAALGPMAWCGLFAWIVFTTHLGYNSRLGDVMSWRGFLITTRLSYGIYLTQFPVFFYNVGRRRYAGQYEFFSHMLNVHEWVFIVLTSAALTLLFEAPFQNIKKCWFAGAVRPATKPVNNERPPAVLNNGKLVEDAAIQKKCT